MKKYVSVFILSVVMVLGANAQKLSKMAPKIVAIGIGEKNPTLNEKQFPNLKFYYSPNLIQESEGSEVNSAIVAM